MPENNSGVNLNTQALISSQMQLGIICYIQPFTLNSMIGQAFELDLIYVIFERKLRSNTKFS